MNLCLANCYFSQDSSGSSVLLRFFDAQSCRSFHPFHRRPGSVARPWRGRSLIAESLLLRHQILILSRPRKTIPQSTRVGADPRWLVWGRHVCTLVHILRTVSYEWDPAKAKTSFAKHRVRFADVVTVLEDDLALTIRDPFSDEEERWIALGRDVLGRFLVVVYT
jgi:hypothetical protein